MLKTVLAPSKQRAPSLNINTAVTAVENFHYHTGMSPLDLINEPASPITVLMSLYSPTTYQEPSPVSPLVAFPKDSVFMPTRAISPDLAGLLADAKDPNSFEW